VNWLSQFRKSGLTAAFFMVLNCGSSGVQAHSTESSLWRQEWAEPIDAKQLDQHHVWHALLHLTEGRPQIEDSSFLLTGQNFSPRREMLATLASLYGPDNQAVCRFPARYLWLQAELGLPALNTAACAEIQEFKDKAPFDELSLVFATESTSEPASMMGHAFLKISGKTPTQSLRTHAVSYYTDANSINLPKELWESLVSGKKGIFSLTPYDQEIAKYVDKEHRNLWEYTLQTTQAQRDLIRNHLFELKQTRLNYFLHRYNCATVLLNIVRLIHALPDAGVNWTTPKDVVKQAQKAQLVVATTVHLSAPWTYQHLRPLQNKPAAALALNFLRSEPPAWTSPPAPDQGQYVQALNSVLYHSKQISDARRAENQRQLGLANDFAPPPTLALPETINPARAGGDAHVGLSGLSRTQGMSTLLHWVPASHGLSDRSHNPQAETEFQLFSGTLEISPRQQIKLHQFRILSTQSLMPWDPWLKPLSRQTRIGYGAWTPHPNDPKHWHAHLAWGLTHRLQPQLDLSLLGGAGLQLRSGASSLFASAEVSAIYRASPHTKTLLGWHRWQGPHDRVQQIKAKQMVYPNADLAFWADIEVTLRQAIRRHTLGLGIQKSF